MLFVVLVRAADILQPCHCQGGVTSHPAFPNRVRNILSDYRDP
jgi:hypothetical protein